MHVKRQIQHALRAALAAHMPVQAVYLDRLDAVPTGRLPVVLVRESERGEVITSLSTEGLQQRDLLVDVAHVVAQRDGAGDAADELGLQAELLLAAHPDEAVPEVQQLQALCAMGIALRSANAYLSGEGELAAAVLRQVWRFSYVVDAEAPDVALAS